MKPRTIPFAVLALTLMLTAGAASAQTEPATCGGIANLQCPAGQACLYAFGQCNAPDITGTCTVVEETCPKQGPPICGCDGTTYDNQCELLKAGVRPDRRGNCGNKKKEDKPPVTQAVCAVASPKSS
jgi:hypothetical protein